MKEAAYLFEKSQGNHAPVIISIPHMGTEIPKDVAEKMNPEALAHLRDTDWIVDQLYPFALDMGISVLKAKYSRYVVDLNRPVNKVSLYNDGREETSIVSPHDFDGRPLYKKGMYPKEEEIESRISQYYEPYHSKLLDEVKKLKQQFKKVLVFEAHSIRRSVPKLHPKPFPDLILGNQNDRTCPKRVIDGAYDILSAANYNVSKNNPFMGGYITRSLAQIEDGVFTLQLETSQDLYLKDDHSLDDDKCINLIQALEKMLKFLIKELQD